MTYGLGSENRDLPAYVVMMSGTLIAASEWEPRMTKLAGVRNYVRPMAPCRSDDDSRTRMFPDNKYAVLIVEDDSSARLGLEDGAADQSC